MVTYFAYGSNLNLANWHSWCGENGFASDLLRPVGVARLPDYRLAFSRRSIRRGGGALNVVPAVGHVVEGMLIQVDGNGGWHALDRKEGAPCWYRRTPVFVQKENGEMTETATYVVNPEFSDPFVTPAPGYAELVREGLRQWGLGSVALDLAEKNLPGSGLVNRLFCYGTLMQGECRFPVLEKLGFDSLSPATVRGQLFNLGPYPALVTGTNVDGIVHGELFTLTYVKKSTGATGSGRRVFRTWVAAESLFPTAYESGVSRRFSVAMGLGIRLSAKPRREPDCKRQ